MKQNAGQMLIDSRSVFPFAYFARPSLNASFEIQEEKYARYLLSPHSVIKHPEFGGSSAHTVVNETDDESAEPTRIEFSECVEVPGFAEIGVGAGPAGDDHHVVAARTTSVGTRA